MAQRFGGLHQRDSRSALFEGYSGGDSSRRGGSPAGGYGYHSSSNTGSPSPYNSYSAYGNPNIGPGGGSGGPPGGYRSATPNQKGQYSDAVLNELESQNDAQVAGILGKVRTLKDGSSQKKQRRRKTSDIDMVQGDLWLQNDDGLMC
ncbi:hypothetical protein BBAD15_g10825 [Beauveria bassiana D1-5]|uniref:Uncharacterized protein n=1 Tax=Beauveria bassiana D1-5 TaxID=1245745 RepID=A0A0A2V8U0_BEABA|nr:hypothetical protein BBAD15_g10825 [Beauveria bassiana D1-5]